MGNLPILHACFEALDKFITENNRMPKSWNREDAENFVKLTQDIASTNDQEFNDKWQNLCRLFSFT